MSVVAWEGWKYDAAIRRLLAPRAAILSPSQGAAFAALLAAAGAPVAARAIAEAISETSRSRDPLNCVGMTVHKLNALFKALKMSGTGIENVRRFGYRLRPVNAPLPSPDEVAAAEAVARRRASVEAVLIEELEATGPHARAVSRMIETIYNPEEKK